MLGFTTICLAVLVAGQAAADSCWRRDYDAGHIVSQPSETVRMLTIRLPDTVEGDGKVVAHGRSRQTNTGGRS